MEKKWLETHDSFVWKVMAMFPVTNQVIHCPKVFRTFWEAKEEMDNFRNHFNGVVYLRPYLAETETKEINVDNFGWVML